MLESADTVAKHGDAVMPDRYEDELREKIEERKRQIITTQWNLFQKAPSQITVA